MSPEFAYAEHKFRNGDYSETLEALNALADLSDNSQALNLLGDTFAHLGMISDAADIFEQAAAKADDWQVPFLKKSAVLFFAVGNKAKAELHALRLLALQPDDPNAAFILLSILDPRRYRDLCNQLRYNLVNSTELAHLELAHKLLGEDRADGRLLPLFRNLAALKPDDEHIRATLMSFAREYADYDTLDMLEAGADGQAPIVGERPLDNLLWRGQEAQNREGVSRHLPVPFSARMREQRRTSAHKWGQKLRVGYISADFRPSHVVMRQLAGVLRHHDRQRFEITLFSNSKESPDHKRPGQKQIAAALGTYVGIAGLTDKQAAKEIKRRNIDILVDLNGYTTDTRVHLLNLGLAPIQVCWLGFPDSSVGVDSDYIITDAIVTPESSKPYYDEKFCRMPESYMPNDSAMRKTPGDVDRAAWGLPADKFVFASFNAPKKVTPAVIALWADILERTPGSILWMACRSATAEENIARRFQKLGIDPARIIFADAVRSYEEHIERMRAADLGLDPFPYNGHATTSDCLWAGLPVLALKGHNFASRASQSQLHCIGLDELVAATPQDYVSRAVELASQPEMLRDYRARLDESRFTAPLFDAERYARHLEQAYEMMATRARAGQEPDHFDVERLPARDEAFG